MNLGYPEMLGQATAIASVEPIQPRSSIATQRLIPGCALREEQSFDPVDVLDPFHDQHLALTANPAAVFIFRRQRLNHRADPRFTPRKCKASSARSKVSPAILSVLARRRRREVAIEAASTTWLSIPSLSKAR